MVETKGGSWSSLAAGLRTVSSSGFGVAVGATLVALFLNAVAWYSLKITRPANLDGYDQAALTGLSHLAAVDISGVFSVGPQTRVTQIGPLVSDVDLQNRDVLRVNRLTMSDGIWGQVTTSDQRFITSVGTLSHDLNLQGHDMTRVGTLKAETVDAQHQNSSGGDGSNITQIGVMSQDLNVVGQLRHVQTLSAFTVDALLDPSSFASLVSLGPWQSDWTSTGTWQNVNQVQVNTVRTATLAGPNQVLTLEETEAYIGNAALFRPGSGNPSSNLLAWDAVPGNVNGAIYVQQSGLYHIRIRGVSLQTSEALDASVDVGVGLFRSSTTTDDSATSDPLTTDLDRIICYGEWRVTVVARNVDVGVVGQVCRIPEDVQTITHLSAQDVLYLVCTHGFPTQDQADSGFTFTFLH